MFSRARIAAIVLLVAGALVMATASAYAQSPATATFTVQTNVLKRCTVSAPALTFPNYNPLTGAAVDGSTTLTIACTKGTAATILLNDGSRNNRTLSDGTEFLTYNLFSDAYTTVWNGTNTITYNAPDRTDHTYTIYGRIAANQDVADRGVAYTDTVTVTVNY